MRFNFRLRPLGDIAPWHDDAHGSHPHLSWFGLTDGWYWIDVDGAELFRYSQAVLDKWAREDRDKPWLARMEGLPYVDYHVAQLWADVLSFLPDVLAPIPARLAKALATEGVWMVWERHAAAAVTRALPKREAGDLLYDATRWLGKRALDSTYLVSGPRIWCWSAGVEVHVRWDNRARTLDDLPAWEAPMGHSAMPAEAFADTVRAFNARFLRRMADRVAIAKSTWARPEVVLDPHVAEDQLAQVEWSRGRLEASAPRELDDWDAVFRAIERIEALPQFTSGAAKPLP